MLQILPSYGRKVGVFDISCGLLVTGSTDRTIEVRREAQREEKPSQEHRGMKKKKEKRRDEGIGKEKRREEKREERR